MSTQRYSVTPHPIETVLALVKSCEIAIHEIQSPFWRVLAGRRQSMTLKIKNWFEVL